MRGFQRVVFVTLIGLAAIVLLRFTPLKVIPSGLQRVTNPITNGLYRAGVSLKGALRSVSNNTSTQLSAEDEARLSEYERLQSENKSLRDQLGFVTDNDLTFIGADVVGQSSSVLERTLKINIGSENGISEGQAVVSSGYLIGQIRNLRARTAEVVLVIDPAFRTTGVVAGTNISGLITAQVGGIIILDDIATAKQIKEGDTVLSSSLDENIPQGLRIGSVVRVEDIDGSILKRARLTSPVDFNSIQTVFVVR